MVWFYGVSLTIPEQSNKSTHSDTDSWRRQTRDGASGCVGAWSPSGFVCGLFAGGSRGVRGLPTTLSLAPACPGGERTASVQRRMLPIRVCGRTDTQDKCSTDEMDRWSVYVFGEWNTHLKQQTDAFWGIKHARTWYYYLTSDYQTCGLLFVILVGEGPWQSIKFWHYSQNPQTTLNPQTT